MEDLSKLRFSVSCNLPPLPKVVAIAETENRARELSARLMLKALKCSNILKYTPSPNSSKIITDYRPPKVNILIITDISAIVTSNKFSK